ncbi:helix-turn-helix domain-containing protein [Paracoccus marinaquae]|uniref:Helix-turn-helix domain-containing protein n=1 Tax=Paracoccus marinaquae TaxID=2841926 RepID=A0ABS6AGU5_9RHOB|nr:helix-turn-helix domain-containing protein [Paracoccus marinaquae]MBU3029167.1 helix-turn-helix domain-containing protein [Paracoccus marinaquae]
MRDDERQEIRGLEIFANMAEPSFDAMMQAAYAQEFPAQLQLVRQGGRADFLHVLVEGTVELFAEWNGHDTTMAILRPVTSFILAACMRDAHYLMSARTLQPSRIVLIPAVDIRETFRRDPDFAVDAANELASAYRSMVRHAKSLKLRNSRERLAAYLLRLSAENGGAAGFMLPHEKRLLASHLGMTPESLSRAFRALSDHGVHIQGMRVTLTDPDQVRDIAVPDPLID